MGKLPNERLKKPGDSDWMMQLPDEGVYINECCPSKCTKITY